MKNIESTFQSCVLILLIGLTILLSIYQTGYLPDITPASAARNEFSAERAKKHVGVIAVEPHETGSRQIKAVQGYIMGELSNLGLQPEIQPATMNNRQVFGNIQNIIAKIQGTDNRNAILIVSHYDTVASSPGASDNTIGVATMIEAARAMKSNDPPKNSIIFLFTDAEETGSLGAAAFIKEHRWAKEVKLVLNLDAGGMNGPAYLIDTSPLNEQIIREYSKVVPNPVGNGAGQAFGSSGSDFNSFKTAGYSGLYIALAGDARIHTSLDNIKNFNDRSLQHMGDTTLSLVQRFSVMDLNSPNISDASYFNFMGRSMFYYPVSWAIPLVIFVLLLFFLMLFLGFKKKRLTFKGIAFGTAVFILSMVTSALVVAGIWKVLSALHPAYKSLIGGHACNEVFIWIVFICVTILFTVLWYSLIRRFMKVSISDLSIGPIIIIMLAAFAISFLKPMAGYIFTIPLFFSISALGYWFYSSNINQKALSAVQLILFLISSIVSVNLLVPPIYAGFITSETSGDFAMSVFIVILAGFLLPHIFFISGKYVRSCLSMIILLAAIASSVIVLTAGLDKHNTQPSTAFYIMDSDTGKAYWGGGIPGNNSKLDEWTGQYFPESTKKAPITDSIKNMPYNYDFYIAQAPSLQLEAPIIRLLDKSTAGDVQTLRLHIRSPRKASRIEAFLERGQEMISSEVNGALWVRKSEPPKWGPSNIVFSYNGLPEAGIEAIIRIPANKPARLIFLERTYGIPKIPGLATIPMPERIVPYVYASPLSQDTIVLKTVEY